MIYIIEETEDAPIGEGLKNTTWHEIARTRSDWRSSDIAAQACQLFPKSWIRVREVADDDPGGEKSLVTPCTHGGARSGAGRKPSPTRSVTFTLRLPPELAEWVAREADSTGTTRAQVVCQAVRASMASTPAE